MYKIDLRNEISGLRALAIIPVILFHLNYSSFEGGFVGVDIFFVISGYLITSVIVKNNTNFNIFYFYERRLRRILPLLLFVAILTIPFAYYFMLPKNLLDYAQSLSLTPIFFSNFLFWMEEGYWEFSSQMKPLLHTWSLSVEAQFYLFFPLIFFLKNKNKIFLILIFLWVLSFFIAINQDLKILSIVTDKILSLGSFYLPFSRFWEFLTGSLVFYFHKKMKFENEKINNSLCILGFLLILYAIFNLNDDLNYPNILSLFPVLGTGLILIYIEKSFLLYKTLTSKFFNHIGDISYSLYLWHFPIIVFSKYFSNLNQNIFLDILAILATYLLALFSFTYIEKPFYKYNYLSSKAFLISILILAFIVFSTGVIIYKSGGKSSFVDIKINKLKKELISYNDYFEKDLKPDDAGIIKFSNFTDQTSNENVKKILIIGDSQGRDLTRVLREYNNIKIKNNEVVEHEFGFLEISSNYSINKNLYLHDQIQESDIVLLSRQFTSEKNKIQNIKKLANILSNEGKKFVIVGSAPEFYTAEDDLLLTFLLQNENNYNYLKNKNYSRINEYFYLNLRTYLFETNNYLEKISKELNIGFLDRFNFTCVLENKKCFGIDEDGSKLFKDYSHFSESGVKFFANKIYEINWLKKIK